MELGGQNIYPTTFAPHVWHFKGKLGVNLPHLPHHPNRPLISHCLSSAAVGEGFIRLHTQATLLHEPERGEERRTG
jgi:hypothetical protein